MSFLDLKGINEVPDLELLQDGEYQFQCQSAEVKDSKSTEGNQYVQLVLKPLGVSNAQNVFHNAMLPNSNDDEDKRNTKLRMFRDMLKAFGLDGAMENLQTNDFIGQTVYAIVKTEQGDTAYPPKNVVKKWVIPA